MKKVCVFLIVLYFVISSCNKSIAAQPADNTDSNSEEQYKAAAKRDLLCLMMSYPEYVSGVDVDSENRTFLVMKSGKKILYDDKKQKSFEQKLQNGDLQDMMELIYPLGHISQVPQKNFDPGRIRVYALLYEVYGGNLQSIQKNLINTNVGYKKMLFNKNNGASQAIAAAMKELAAGDTRVRSAVFPVNGTFNYRKIAGTNQLSAHSFGIAIDLVTQKNDYWKWASLDAANKRISKYPREVANIFEKHNFIWGGKWSHFDIMHYEYRPELIMKSRYFSKPVEAGKPWYDGIPAEENTQKFIKVIDTKI